ncbi:hypothetical protein MIR68_001001 [Amoeboaphelidium protococcarum]|nr:hypothetical protein MIR68_001001 [Amoeboaphelidium protococcarum]
MVNQHLILMIVFIIIQIWSISVLAENLKIRDLVDKHYGQSVVFEGPAAFRSPQCKTIYDKITFTELPSRLGDIPGYKADMSQLMFYLAFDPVGSILQNLDVSTCVKSLYDMVDSYDAYRPSILKPFFIYAFDYAKSIVINSMIAQRRNVLYEKIFDVTQLPSLLKDELLFKDGKSPLCTESLMDALPIHKFGMDLAENAFYSNNQDFIYYLISLVFQRLGSDAGNFLAKMMYSSISLKRTVLSQLLYANHFESNTELTRQFFTACADKINMYGVQRNLINMLAVLDVVRDFTLVPVAESGQSRLNLLSIEVLTQVVQYHFVFSSYALLTGSKDLNHDHPDVIAESFQTMSAQQILRYFYPLCPEQKAVFVRLRVDAQLLLVHFAQFSLQQVDQVQFHRLKFNVRLALLKREAPSVVQSQNQQDNEMRRSRTMESSGHVLQPAQHQQVDFLRVLDQGGYDNNIVILLRKMYMKVIYSDQQAQSVDFDRALLNVDWSHCRANFQLIQQDSRLYCLLLARIVFLRKQQNPHDGFMADISVDQLPPLVDTLHFPTFQGDPRYRNGVFRSDVRIFAPSQDTTLEDDTTQQIEQARVQEGHENLQRQRRVDTYEAQQQLAVADGGNDNYFDEIFAMDMSH